MEYKKFQGLIKKKVFEIGFRKKYFDYDELQGEANYIFSKCVKEFDAGKASFCTYLNMKLNYGLIDFINREKKSCLMEECPDPEYLPKTILPFLSDKGKKIYSLLLELPEFFDSQKVNKGMIKKYLRIHGWKWNDIQEGFLNIKSVI